MFSLFTIFLSFYTRFVKKNYKEMRSYFYSVRGTRKSFHERREYSENLAFYLVRVISYGEISVFIQRMRKHGVPSSEPVGLGRVEWGLPKYEKAVYFTPDKCFE